MIDWPKDLPQLLDVRGARISLADNRLRSQVDSGPPKVRRKVTLNVEPLSGTMRLSTAELKRLRRFVDVELAGGTQPFRFPDPLAEGDATLVVRFADELPGARATAQDRWLVALDLEVLP